jgi:glycosyltransferase involved in cell wall biosynthesis
MSVAVISTCFNEEDYIEECVRSVVRQTHPPAQHIVVNDGSTDGSQAILDNLPAQVLEVTNRGMPGARNAGVMALAPGIEWVVFLDGDDWLAPTFIEEILREDRGSPRPDILIPMFQREPGGRPEFPRIFHPSEAMLHEECLISFGVIRRRLLVQAGGFHGLMGCDCDWDFWIDALRRGAVLQYVPRALYHYRQHASSFTANVTSDLRAEHIREKERHRP